MACLKNRPRANPGWRMAAALALAAMIAATPAAAQTGPAVPLGRPVEDPGPTPVQPPDSLLSEGVAPGAMHPGPLAPAWATETVRALERRLATDVAADGVGSIAAAVLVGDAVVWSAAFGHADRDAGTLAGPATVYRAGSLSKPVTALVLLALVQRGVIALDDAVDPYLPELERLANRAPDHPRIRFSDLASHTAGLAREPGTSHAARGPARHWRRKLLDAVPVTDAIHHPGEKYHYSNVGYALLGLALERAAGRPFEVLAQELVFDPLGMTSSYFVVPPAHRHRLAAGYVNLAPDAIDPRVPRAEHRGQGYRLPSAGLYSTVGDLARIAMAMTGALGDSPFQPTSRAAALGQSGQPPDLMTPARGLDGPGTDPNTDYGLGFQIHRIGDTVIGGHSGAAAGYTSYLAFEPRSGVAVVLLRNYNNGATNLGSTAVRAVLDLAQHPDALPAGPRR
jgi:CubicO group peptidase (beta-lactamase class C family)